MKKFTVREPMSRMDKLYLAAIAGVILAVSLLDLAMDAEPNQTADEDIPFVEAVSVISPVVDCAPAVKAVEMEKGGVQAALYDDTIPLDQELQEALRDACERYGVPFQLSLGLIEVESGFQADAVSQEGCYGLMQLNPRYFPADLAPSENIRAGVSYLGELLERYENTASALRAYNRGFDDGSRGYSNAVLEAAEKWGCDDASE